jgi:hypothetical protein
MTRGSRDLTVSIQEAFDVVVSGEEELNPKFKGALPPMPTRLQITYDRKTRTGKTCVDPLNPVYLDSLVEALAYLLSITANHAEQIPLLSGLLIGRLTSRTQVYAKAKFPNFPETMTEQIRTLIMNPMAIDEKKQAFMEYFNMQLSGIKEPCKKCEKAKECKFKGQFDPPKKVKKENVEP